MPGKSRGLRSLVGYNPWGFKESDMIEQLNNNKLDSADLEGMCSMKKASKAWEWGG